MMCLIELRSDSGALSQFLAGIDPQAQLADLFRKSALAPGRLVASFIAFQFAYLAATLLWKPIFRSLGWLLLPLGQNSLYCYTMHIAVIGSLYALLPRLPIDVLSMGTLNTSLQMLAVLSIWAMARNKFLFKVVPR
jgi:fucose 4-O-acetylase-like acetyltransferase